jgi:hypothetical protein
MSDSPVVRPKFVDARALYTSAMDCTVPVPVYSSEQYTALQNTCTTQAQTIETLRERLRLAAQTFRRYEALHRAKPDHVKADANKMLAEQMEGVIPAYATLSQRLEDAAHHLACDNRSDAANAVRQASDELSSLGNEVQRLRALLLDRRPSTDATSSSNGE